MLWLRPKVRVLRHWEEAPGDLQTNSRQGTAAEGLTMGQDRDETHYSQGSRAAWASMLAECLRQLGINDPEVRRMRWISEREAVVSQLRSICADYGDNDWPDDLHLGDVVSKHLANHLRSR